MKATVKVRGGFAMNISLSAGIPASACRHARALVTALLRCFLACSAACVCLPESLSSSVAIERVGVQLFVFMWGFGVDRCVTRRPLRIFVLFFVCPIFVFNENQPLACVPT